MNAQALLTDLYQLTMAAGYHHAGRANDEAVFHLTFRKAPFEGGFTIAAGLEPVTEFLESFRFEPDDIEYLETLRGRDGEPLFEAAFLEELSGFALTCDVDAIPEGTVVFPHEPLVRVQGSLVECQLVESALLNAINFQSLIATKAARICAAAQGDPVLEFGLRRAQGPDGAIAAARAAFIGGCIATSNVMAGKIYGIPVRGTHAHSWVMTFDSERQAFKAYAEAQPNNVTLLVDTFDTLEGVSQAIETGRELRENGGDLAGIRLDSGDLAYLSIEARRLLDAAGFEETKIVATNDLDEHIIESLKAQGACIDTWGVGTKLVTAFDEPALGGVYKLSALRKSNGDWVPKIKLSEQSAKVSTPGFLQVRRFFDESGAIADAIYDEHLGIGPRVTVVDPAEPLRRRRVNEHLDHEDLLKPVFRSGKRVGPLPSLVDIQERARMQLERLHPGVRRFANPHRYPAGLELGLFKRRESLIEAARAEID